MDTSPTQSLGLMPYLMVATVKMGVQQGFLASVSSTARFPTNSKPHLVPMAIFGLRGRTMRGRRRSTRCTRSGEGGKLRG